MKSHPEGREGKCLPAGYKVSSRALNSGEIHSGAEPCQGAPAVHSSAAARGAGAASCTPALSRDGLGTGLRAARAKGALLARHECDVFPTPKTDPPPSSVFFWDGSASACPWECGTWPFSNGFAVPSPVPCMPPSSPLGSDHTQYPSPQVL